MKHPLICPKCWYHRPLGLTYCPNCRENDKKPTIKELKTIAKPKKVKKKTKK